MPYISACLGLALSAFAASCATARPGVVTEAGYRAMGRAEAHLFRALARRARASDCEAQRAAARAACEQAEAICALSASLQETDARLRCEDARERCARAAPEALCHDQSREEGSP